MSAPQEQPGRPWRLFIAITAPPAVQELATSVIGRLKGAGDVRWVAPDRLHLTLKFLGDSAPEKVPEVKEVLAETANRFSRFVLECSGVGAFPNPRKPQTLWLGVGPGETITQLAKELEDRLAAVGFPPERKAFKPHLTIGRVKSSKGLADLAQRVQRDRDGSSATWSVGEIHLIRSILHPQGPEYIPLAMIPLGRTAGKPEE